MIAHFRRGECSLTQKAAGRAVAAHRPGQRLTARRSLLLPHTCTPITSHAIHLCRQREALVCAINHNCKAVWNATLDRFELVACSKSAASVSPSASWNVQCPRRSRVYAKIGDVAARSGRICRSRTKAPATRPRHCQSNVTTPERLQGSALEALIGNGEKSRFW